MLPHAIGMVNAPRFWPIEEYKDIEELEYYREAGKQTETRSYNVRCHIVMLRSRPPYSSL